MTNNEKQEKRPIIGHKMREALDYIKLNPYSRTSYIDRLFGQSCSERLIKAGLVSHQAANDGLGDKLKVLRQVDQAKFKAKFEANPGYQLIYPRSKMPRAELIKHNILYVKCEVCKVPSGRPCISIKDGREVRFPHGARIDQLIFMLLVLAEPNE